MAASPSERDPRILDLLLDRQALQRGDFVTKSGRRVSYFVNFSRLGDGEALGRLAVGYANEIQRLDEHGARVGAIVGSAYKGIPLAAAVAVELSRRWSRPVLYYFDRKEAKTHGDGGLWVGVLPRPSDVASGAIVVDDVLTAGTSVSQLLPRLGPELSLDPLGVVVGVDREDPSAWDPGLPAREAIARKWGIPVRSLVRASQLSGPQ